MNNAAGKKVFSVLFLNTILVSLTTLKPNQQSVRYLLHCFLDFSGESLLSCAKFHSSLHRIAEGKNIDFNKFSELTFTP